MNDIELTRVEALDMLAGIERASRSADHNGDISLELELDGLRRVLTDKLFPSLPDQ